MMKKILLSLIAAVALINVTAIYANDAPVVDLTQQSDQSTDAAYAGSASASDAASDDSSFPSVQSNASSASVTDTSTSMAPAEQSTASMGMSQRVARLENQMNNLVRMNLPQQIADIQQSLQQVQGQLQEQAHTLATLTQQQKSYYQDLDARINQLKGSSNSINNAGTPPASATPPSPVDASPQTSSGKPMVSTDAGATAAQPSETNVYKAAFTYLNQKKYSQAKQAFNDYLTNYPSGQYQANAHYWLGEIYSRQKDNSQALLQYKTIVAQFPKSDKVPDSKLKMGIILVKQGKVTEAKKAFNEVKSQYPESTAAQLASLQLQELSLQDSSGK